MTVSDIQLVGADRLFDGEGPFIESGGVAWQDGVIVATGPWGELVQGYGAHTDAHTNAHPGAHNSAYFPGCTLLPGLIDLHTHLVMPGTGVDMMHWSAQPDAVLLLTALHNCRVALAAGVTTVVDLGARGTLTFELRHALEALAIDAPRLLLCGRAITITGGHAWPWHGEADGAEGVRHAVRQLCKEGADVIKVMASGGGTPGTDGRRPSFTQIELDALVDEAHARNRPVFAHCTAARAIKRALNAGVDCIAHAQFLAPDGSNQVDEALVQRMVMDAVAVNPTLQINRILGSGRVDLAAMTAPQRTRHKAWVARYPEFAQAFRTMHEAGVAMVCGTDCGWGYSPFDELHLELDAMVEAGMTPLEALVSATSGAARVLRNDQIGRLAPGCAADLLVVEGDPSRAINDLARVRGVWRDGKAVHTLPATNISPE
jgi:imidazolonepropionase-like amidohydrolase